MKIIRSMHVLGLLALLVLTPGYLVGAAATLAAAPVRDPETVRLEQTVFGPLLTEACRFPAQVQIIGASKFQTWLAAARRALTLVIDWAECKQLVPFSITLFWLPVSRAGHVSGLLSSLGRLTSGTPWLVQLRSVPNTI